MFPQDLIDSLCIFLASLSLMSPTSVIGEFMLVKIDVASMVRIIKLMLLFLKCVQLRTSAFLAKAIIIVI